MLAQPPPPLLREWRPPGFCSFLRPGAAFVGVQRLLQPGACGGKQQWSVRVVLHVSLVGMLLGTLLGVCCGGSPRRRCAWRLRSRLALRRRQRACTSPPAGLLPVWCCCARAACRRRLIVRAAACAAACARQTSRGWTCPSTPSSRAAS
jgi:hypothetical protein